MAELCVKLQPQNAGQWWNAFLPYQRVNLTWLLNPSDMLIDFEFTAWLIRNHWEKGYCTL
jgi:hypothetical protein